MDDDTEALAVGRAILAELNLLRDMETRARAIAAIKINNAWDVATVHAARVILDEIEPRRAAGGLDTRRGRER